MTKYSQSGATWSERLRRARDEVSERGLRHTIRRKLGATALQGRRPVVAAWRYVSWAAVSATPPGSFVFRGSEYRYFRHPYNTTWRNERAVELPIVLAAIERARDARVLEVGNVLAHYVRHDHDVVDRYERGENVQNVDIVDFRSPEPYDLIVSISTLEHVGWDDGERDPGKLRRAVARLRSLLAPGGRALVTLPLGYNHDLDEMIWAGTAGFDEERFLLRVRRAEWREVEKSRLGRPAYGRPFPAANALVVATIERRG